MEAQDVAEVAEGMNELKEKYLYLKTRSKIIHRKTRELESRAEKMYCDKGATKWSQILATLTLSSEQIRLEKYNYCNKNKTAVTCHKNLEKDILVTEEFKSNRIKEIRNEILKKVKVIENNKEQEQQLQKEIMLAEKRNNALLIRIGRQLQQAECMYQQTKTDHDSLDDVLSQKYVMLKQHE